MMRPTAAILAFCGLAAPALAGVDCAPEHAIYTHEDSGFRVSFRPMQSWEQSGMALAVFDVALKDGRTLWGTISSNMGTSRDTGQIYLDCPRPGPDDAYDPEALAGCMVWEGVVYSVDDTTVGAFPQAGEKAPASLLFADLGRQLRYEIFDSPGDEPWDQLLLTGCTPG